MGRRKRQGKSDWSDKRPPGLFVPLSHIVIRSTPFAMLSAHGVKLLVDILAQYDSRNNGDLTATWTFMERRGWRSRDTLRNALKELLERRWIQQTRQGGRNRPSLYGVTIYALDALEKIDICQSDFDRGGWAKGPLEPTRPRKRKHVRRDGTQTIDTPIGSTHRQQIVN